MIRHKVQLYVSIYKTVWVPFNDQWPTRLYKGYVKPDQPPDCHTSGDIRSGHFNQVFIPTGTISKAFSLD